MSAFLNVYFPSLKILNSIQLVLNIILVAVYNIFPKVTVFLFLDDKYLLVLR